MAARRCGWRWPATGDQARTRHDAWAAQMAAEPPDFTIHLGDIYYVGTLPEVNEHFLGVDNPHNDYTPCTWPSGRSAASRWRQPRDVRLGDALFELLLPQFGMQSPDRRQQTSFFCLENDRLARVASTRATTRSAGRLSSVLRPRLAARACAAAWLRDDVKLGARGGSPGHRAPEPPSVLLGLRRVVPQSGAAARRVHQSRRCLVLGARASADRLRRARLRAAASPRTAGVSGMAACPSIARPDRTVQAPRVPAAVRGQPRLSERRGHRRRLQRLRA